MSASSSPIVVANVGEINRGRSGSKDEDIIVAQFAVEKKSAYRGILSQDQ